MNGRILALGILIVMMSCQDATNAQDIDARNQNDADFIRALFDSSLVNGQSHRSLRYLCKEIGPRLSGSPNAARSVEYGKRLMDSYGFDRVWLQEIQVPHWERGAEEEAWLHVDNSQVRLRICALGGSVGTEGLLTAPLIEARNMEHLKQLGDSVRGKIVFINQAMDPTKISTFQAYGGCYQQRAYGASEAARFGALAVIVRSLTLSLDFYPHTGSLQYKEGVDKIPAAAVSTRDAVLIKRYLLDGRELSVSLSMSCKNYGMVTSYNVIGEITGKNKPQEIIAVGGHLDSWDLGEGAHDDGTGVIHSLEALRLLKVCGYEPQRTLRVIWFMNEENGNNGGKTYAAVAKEKGEVHYAAIESDRGGFAPRGFSLDGSESQLQGIRGFSELFKPYGTHYFEEGYGGVDIGPLKDGKVALIGFVPDSQRYFDHHHAQTDVFESVNKRELEMGSAAIAALIYLIDQYGLGTPSP